MSPTFAYPSFFITNVEEYFQLLYSTYKSISPHTSISSGHTGAQVPISSTSSTFFTLGTSTVTHHPVEANLLYEYGKAFEYHAIVKNLDTGIQIVNVPYLPSGVFRP